MVELLLVGLRSVCGRNDPEHPLPLDWVVEDGLMGNVLTINWEMDYFAGFG